MTLTEAIRNKLKGLDDLPEGWVTSLAKFQPKMARELTKMLESLTLTSTGAVEMTAANLSQVSVIMARLQQWLTASEYVDIIGQLAQEMQGQQAATMAYFDTAFGSNVTASTFAAEVYNTGRAQLIADLIPENLRQALYQPLRSVLANGIQTGAGYSSLLADIQTIAQGAEGVDGFLMRYSRVIVTDTIATTDRAYTDIIANDLGLQWYAYLGGKMDTTRCFCMKRNGKFFHRKEIEGWGRGEGVGECGYPWAGMNKSTDSNTIFAYAGGYNCQHSMLPVSDFSVPKEDVLRAVAKGWYKPDKVAKEYFGIS